MKTKVSFTTIQFTSNSMADLRGKQSVRTTFKLSEKAIDALSILACQMGIKQKTLFDHLMDDLPALKMIGEGQHAMDRDVPRVAKTYVVSRRTLDNLEMISSRYNAPRDSLVERSIERIYPLIDLEKVKHKRRKELHGEMIRMLEKGRKLLIESDDQFDPDDPVFAKYFQVMRSFESSCRDVERYLEKGRKVEEF